MSKIIRGIFEEIVFLNYLYSEENTNINYNSIDLSHSVLYYLYPSYTGKVYQYNTSIGYRISFFSQHIILLYSSGILNKYFDNINIFIEGNINTDIEMSTVINFINENIIFNNCFWKNTDIEKSFLKEKLGKFIIEKQLG